MALLLFSAGGLLLRAEGSALDTLGITGNLLIGQPAEQVFAAHPEAQRTIRRAFTGEAAAARVTMAGGSWLLRAHPIRAGEQLQGVVVVAAALPQDEPARDERNRMLSEAAFEGMVVHQDGRIVAVNDALTVLFGWDADALLGKPLRMLFSRPVDAAAVDAAPCETVGQRKDGRQFPLEIRSRNLSFQGRPAAAWSVWDISRRKQAQTALEETEVRYKAIFEGANDIIFTIDLKGNITSVNQSGERLLGYSRVEALTMGVDEIIVAEHLDRALSMLRSGLETGQLPVSEIEVLAKGGGRLTLEMSGSLLAADGQPIGLLGVARDVTERKRLERELAESESRYKLAAQAANDGLFDWDMVRGRVYYSPRWKSLLGYDDKSIGDAPDEWVQRIHEEDRPDFLVELDAHVSGRTEQFEFEHRVCHRDGQYRWMLSRGVAVRDDGGKVVRLVGSQTDVTDRKEAEARLIHDAFHDALTRLPNRNMFLDRLRRALGRARRHKRLFAVLFLDLDRFKVANDGLGHSVGDQLLMEISDRLRTCLRPEDTLARFGGDEFTLLLEDLSGPQDAIRVAERIQEALLRPFRVAGHEIVTSASIGITHCTTEYDDPEAIMRDADTAMYRAKALGKARYAVFDQRMHSHAVERLQIEHDLRRSLDERGFELFYQPVVSLRSMQITGFEALLRWKHPERGYVSPAEFIPIVEENGLILPLGQFVLLEACRQAAIWQTRFRDAAGLTVSVNLSPKQFEQTNLVQSLASILQETGMVPGTLRLEITESHLMAYAESVSQLLNELKQLRCKLQIDDFGTGYSSLAYLHRFPFDALKIDRSFVDRLDKEEQANEIVRSIVRLAHGLRMPVIAEGVETAEQLRDIRALGCDYGQGYLFSRPVPAEAATELLANPPVW